MTLTPTNALRCEDCESLFPLDEGGPPLYECGECGTTFNRDNSADGESHRCPSDNRFGTKLADESCPDCEGSEVRVVDAFEDETGELFESEQDHADAAELSEAKAALDQSGVVTMRVQAQGVRLGDQLLLDAGKRTQRLSMPVVAITPTATTANGLKDCYQFGFASSDDLSEVMVPWQDVMVARHDPVHGGWHQSVGRRDLRVDDVWQARTTKRWYVVERTQSTYDKAEGGSITRVWAHDFETGFPYPAAKAYAILSGLFSEVIVRPNR